MIEVKNGILLAAGMSTRMEPLSYETPKALIEVRGEVLIERQIRQLKEANIEEIVIVVGYQKEKFAYLKEKFQVELVYNPYFRERNNHSSLFVVREKLGNTYLSCGDYYFAENPFKKYVKFPYYGLSYKKGKTEEWCVTLEKSGKISAVEIGGEDAWVMQGEVLLDEKFSQFLRRKLEEIIQVEEKKDDYWEDLYVEHLSQMELYGRYMKENQVLEFDSIMELREKFPEFWDNTQSSIIQSLAKEFGCKESEIVDFFPLKQKGRVEGFWFRVKEKIYKYSYDTAGYQEEGVAWNEGRK